MKTSLFHFRILECFHSSYNLKKFYSDIIASLTVAVVALPLSIALAVASGVSPEKGILTAIIAGFMISLLSGSRVQIGGPTGAFVVLINSIVLKYGYDGLLLSTLMAGIFLSLAAFMQLGSIIRYISQSVVIGFTSAIACIIFISQLGDIFGMNYQNLPQEIDDKVFYYIKNFSALDEKVFAVFTSIFLLTIILKKKVKKAPHFLIAIFLTMVANHIFALNLETLGDRFSNMTFSFTQFSLPEFSYKKILLLMPSALTIALLAGLESLLSAIVADSMSGDKHHSNTELLAQGLANMTSSLFGGLPATGAIARTATNIKAGGASPISGLFHAIFIFLMAFMLMNYIYAIPFVSLAVVLVLVAWGMSEHQAFIRYLKSTNDDRLILLSTFTLTLFADLVMGISVGVILSSLLFMRHMSRLETVNDDLNSSARQTFLKNLPKEIFILNFNGPLFFGTVDRIVNAFQNITSDKKVIIINLERVNFIDSGAAKKIEDFIDSLLENTYIILCVPQKDIRHTLKTLKVEKNLSIECIVNSLEEAVHIGKSNLK